MSKFSTTQDIGIDFEFVANMERMDLSPEALEEIEDQILDAIDYSNVADDVTIEDMEIIEGMDCVTESEDCYFDSSYGYHILVQCTIEVNERNDWGSGGICISARRLAEKLSALSYIGDYVDLASIDVSEYEYSDDVNYIDDEPDWDSMPGGPDYYDD